MAPVLCDFGCVLQSFPYRALHCLLFVGSLAHPSIGALAYPAHEYLRAPPQIRTGPLAAFRNASVLGCAEQTPGIQCRRGIGNHPQPRNHFFSFDSAPCRCVRTSGLIFEKTHVHLVESSGFEPEIRSSAVTSHLGSEPMPRRGSPSTARDSKPPRRAGNARRAVRRQRADRPEPRTAPASD